MSIASLSRGFSIIKQWVSLATDWLSFKPWKIPDESSISIIHEEPSVPMGTEVTSPQNVKEGTDQNSVTWEFKKDILDRLDEYFACMRRLRIHDIEAYETFRRIGFCVANGFANGFTEKNWSPWLERSEVRSTMGGVLFVAVSSKSVDKGEENIYPSFVYFQKVKYLPGKVERFSGDVYEVTVLYQERDLIKSEVGRKWHFSSLAAIPSYHIGISSDGSIRLLREYITRTSRIYPRRCRNGRRRKSFEISGASWSVPPWVEDISSQHNITANDWAIGIFATTLVTSNMSKEKLLIKTETNGMAATFGINIKRAPYFFRDRECLINHNGRKKKIFHSVVQHGRTLPSGRHVSVKSHYRGIRSFGWNQYNIHIVLPENAVLLREFSLTAKEHEKEDTSKYLDMPGVAKHLEEVMNA